MAMLTFLRIGKEIHDETEVYLIEHLINRRSPVYRRWLGSFHAAVGRGVSKILSALGFDNLL